MTGSKSKNGRSDQRTTKGPLKKNTKGPLIFFFFEPLQVLEMLCHTTATVYWYANAIGTILFFVAIPKDQIVNLFSCRVPVCHLLYYQTE